MTTETGSFDRDQRQARRAEFRALSSMSRVQVLREVRDRLREALDLLFAHDTELDTIFCDLAATSPGRTADDVRHGTPADDDQVAHAVAGLASFEDHGDLNGLEKCLDILDEGALAQIEARLGRASAVAGLPPAWREAAESLIELAERDPEAARPIRAKLEEIVENHRRRRADGTLAQG